MTATLPFLTSYDPPGTSEGALDPLGLYQVADQLAVKLVPAVRERMQRVRFLTAMSVGALVTEGLEDLPAERDVSPYLVWEWLVVEALMRAKSDDPKVWGVPGTLVAKRALEQYGYLDARSYLKTPRIFGFNGVYKRLAIRLQLVNPYLAPGRHCDRLADAWARGQGLSGLDAARPLIDKWRGVVRRSLSEKPPRTNPGWKSERWDELAEAFAPGAIKARERRCLLDLLHSTDDCSLGALPAMWELQEQFDNDTFAEEQLHDRLEKKAPEYAPVLHAIRAYEAFARTLQDGFDLLRAEAARQDSRGFDVTKMAADHEFSQGVKRLQHQFESAHQALGEVGLTNVSLQHLFAERFAVFQEPLGAGTWARTLCSHHEEVQRRKSAAGKRPWFDRLGGDKIYIRHAYRIPRQKPGPGRYVHDYRGRPIRRFHADLA